MNNPLHIDYIRYPTAQLFRGTLSLHIEQRNNNRFEHKFICYRGCYLTKIRRENAKKCGNYIQPEGFMFTSEVKGTALRFGENILKINIPNKT